MCRRANNFHHVSERFWCEKETNQLKTTSGYRAYTEKYWQKEDNVYGY